MIKYLKLKYIFLFYAIIRFTLHMLVIHIDGKGRIYSTLLLLCSLLYFRKKSTKKKLISGPFVIWGLWVSYTIINTLLQGMNYQMEIWQFITYLTAPLVIMYLISLEEKRDFQITLNVITWAAYLNGIIVFFFEGNQYYKGEGYRLGEILNANELGINAFFSIFFLYLNLRYKKLKLSNFLLLSILPFYLIISSGSRAAFVPLVLLFLSHIIIERSKNLLKTVTIIITGTIILLSLFIYIEKNFIILDRLKRSKIEGEMSANTGTIIDNLGSRSAYFLYGSEIFADHPFFGVGLGNYKFYNPISSQPNHVEIMIQLSELGIIGFFLYFLFNFWIGKHLLFCWKNTHKDKMKEIETLIMGFIIIQALSLTTYTHAHLLVFSLHGFVIRYITETEKLIRQYKKAQFVHSE